MAYSKYFSIMLLSLLLVACSKPVGKKVDNTPEAVFLAYYQALSEGDVATVISLTSFAGRSDEQAGKSQTNTEKRSAAIKEVYDKRGGIAKITVKSKAELAKDLLHFRALVEYANGEHDIIGAYVSNDHGQWKMLSCSVNRPVCVAINFLNGLKYFQSFEDIRHLLAFKDEQEGVNKFYQVESLVDVIKSLEERDGFFYGVGISAIENIDKTHKKLSATLYFMEDKSIELTLVLVKLNNQWKLERIPTYTTTDK